MQASGAHRVLIAEESAELSRTFGASLEAHGLAPQSAHSAEQALQNLGGVEVVLIGGWPEAVVRELVREVKERSEAEVVAVTAGQEARIAGVFDQLALPLDEGVLLRSVQDAQAASRRARRRLARERLAAMGELAGGIAHEINNPMTFVRSNLKFVEDCLLELLGTVALLNDGKPEEALSAWDAAGGQGLYAEVQFAIDEARQGSDRISRVVRELRHASWIPSPTPERFSLLEAVEGAVRMAGGALRRVDVSTRIASELRVECDRDRLTQALMSLIINAAESTEDQALAVTAWAEGPWILLEIAGAGGAPLAHVNRPAGPARGATAAANLGLTIGRQVVLACGGELSVQQKEGGGMTLLVKLPAAGLIAPQ